MADGAASIAILSVDLSISVWLNSAFLRPVPYTIQDIVASCYCSSSVKIQCFFFVVATLHITLEKRFIWLIIITLYFC